MDATLLNYYPCNHNNITFIKESWIIKRTFIGPYLWNKLPHKLRSTQSINSLQFY